MNEIIITILTFLLGGVLGGFVQAIYNYKKEVLSFIWTKRFEENKTIWEITGVLPKYPEDREVSYHDLYNTCLKLKNWYFSNGGIILSNDSRIAYEKLQKKLFAVSNKQPDDKLTPEDYNSMREIFSLFRSDLTRDLTSRNKSLL